jgi:hypothetical protein
VEAALAAARADAVTWCAAALDDAHGRPVRAVALRAHRDDTVEVVLSAPVPTPAGWERPGDDPCRLVVPADAVLEPPTGDTPYRCGTAPLVVAFDAPDGAAVRLDVSATGPLTVATGVLGPVAAALLSTPLADGLDVVVVGVDPARLRRVRGDRRGRLHVATDAAEACALAVALHEDADEPVVVVVRATASDADALAALAATGVSVVTDHRLVLSGYEVVATGEGWRLDPLTWPIGRPSPA